MKKTKKITVRIEPDLYNFLEAIKKSLGTDFSGAVRWCLKTAKINAEAIIKVHRQTQEEFQK